MASKVPVVWGKPQRRIRFDRRNYEGYWLEGTFYPGFPDNPELSDRERLSIARWAEEWNPGGLSSEQKQLLAENPPSITLRHRELSQNQTDLQADGMGALWDSLSEEEQEIVRKPATSPALHETRYPLTVTELAAVTGASEDQIHRWTDEGLLPAFRERDDRRFYSAAMIRAFVLERTPTHTKAVVAAVARGEAGQAFQLIAATLGRAAQDLPPEAAKQLSSLADELSAASRLMTDVAPRP